MVRSPHGRKRLLYCVTLSTLVDDRISGPLLARQAGHVSEALDSWLSKDLTAQVFLDFHWRLKSFQSKSTSANRDLKQIHPHP